MAAEVRKLVSVFLVLSMACGVSAQLAVSPIAMSGTVMRSKFKELQSVVEIQVTDPSGLGYLCYINEDNEFFQVLNRDGSGFHLYFVPKVPAEELPIDTSEYSFTGYCEQGNETSTFKIDVDVLKNQQPVVENGPNVDILNVPLDTTSGNIVGRITATDVDGDVLTFTEVEGAVGFAIDSAGFVKATTHLPLLTSVTATLKASVSDGVTDEVPFLVHISLEKLNDPPVDNSIISETEILESTPAGELIHELNVIDETVFPTLVKTLSIVPATSPNKFVLNGDRIEVIGPFDFATQKEYDLTIDLSDGYKSTSYVIKVKIAEANKPPECGQRSYSASIEEGLAASGISIQPALFSVNDTKDTELTIDLKDFTSDFVIESNNPLVIKPTKDIDCEGTTLTFPLKLSLVVTDKELAEGYCDITVSCVDVNDNPPVPETTLAIFNATIKTSIGASIGQLIATDADLTSPNNDVTFEFKDSDPANAITVFPDGQVFNNLNLADKYGQLIKGEITVKDKGDPSNSAPILFQFDWNDSPTFKNFPNSGTLSEDTVGEFDIVSIQTEDNEGDQISCKAGAITDNGPFDVARDPTDATRCVIKYVGTPSLNTLPNKVIHIEVIVEDGFGGSESKDFKLTLIENSKPVATCATDSPPPLKAGDITPTSIVYKIPINDSEGNPIRCKFTCTPRPELFLYDSSIVALKATENFLSISESSFSCTLRLNDDKHPSPDEDIICEVTISVINLNEPPEVVNDGTTIPVSEQKNVGSNLAFFDVKDEEPVTMKSFSISPPEGNNFLVVDGDTFGIKLIKKLDYETPPNVYTVTTVLTDSYLKTTASVTIEVLDDNDDPVFKAPSYSVTVKEGEELSINEDLGLDVSDPDTTDVHTYRVLNEPTFGLQGTNLINNLKVDLDAPGAKDLYNFQVEADDGNGGTATADVTVKVVHRNEHIPTFKDDAYADCIIGLNTATASDICLGEADDKDRGVVDSLLTYSMGAESHPGYFEVVENVIKLKKLLEPHLYGQLMTVEVIVTDAGTDPGPLTSTKEVSMIWNKPPECTVPRDVDIHENAKATITIPRSDIAMSDPEGDDVTATLRCFPDDGNFRATKVSASLSQVTFVGTQLDFKSLPEYGCVLACVDEGGGTDAHNLTIHVTKNRSPLALCDPIYSMEADATLNKKPDIVGSIPYTDPEGDSISFTTIYTPGTASTFFDVNAGTGNVSVKGDLTNLDADTVFLTVTLEDQFDNTALCKASIEIKNKNEAPKLQPIEIREFFKEDHDPGELFKVPIVDAVECVEGTKMNVFDVIPTTAKSLFRATVVRNSETDSNVVIELRPDQEMDFESQDEYEFRLGVSDGCLSSGEVKVYLTVLDANEPPEITNGQFYSAKFKENSVNECFNLNCGVVDPDVDDTIKWTLSGTESKKFTVTGPNCLICMKQSVELDPLGSGDSRDYTLTVEGKDKGDNPVEFEVVVTVDEENDNDPLFDSGAYAATVTSIDEPKTLLTLNVDDKDANNNGAFYCEAYDCDAAIDSYVTVTSTCELRLEKSMSNFASSGSYKCKVRATDYGNPSRSSESKVDISFQLVTTQPPQTQPTADPNANNNNDNNNNNNANSGANSGSSAGSGSGASSGSGSGAGSGSGVNSALGLLSNSGSGSGTGSGAGSGTGLTSGALAGIIVGALAIGGILAAGAVAGILYCKKKCPARKGAKQNTRTYKVSSRESAIKNNRVNTASSIKVNMNDPGYGHTQVRHLPY